MDWRNKHFALDAVFPAPRDAVLAAARVFADESLSSWKVSETPDGFAASGTSFFHAARATFRIEPAAGGTKLAVALLVERASPLGFMLFDVGGYYDGQLRKWFDGIQSCLYRRVIAGADHLAPEQSSALADWRPAWKNRRSGFQRLLQGVVILWMINLVVLLVVLPLIGLVGGTFYLPLGGDGDITVTGPWGRVVSALILVIPVAYIWRRMQRAGAHR